MSKVSLEIRQSTRFKRDIKRIHKRRWNITELQTVIRKLVDQQPLDPKYRDHSLLGNWKDYRECHIQPDWLLIYRVKENTLELVRTGSHADLF